MNHYKCLIKISVFTYANFLSTPFHHPCYSLFFDRDHLQSNIGIISGPIWGSFPDLGSLADPYSTRKSLVIPRDTWCWVVQFSLVKNPQVSFKAIHVHFGTSVNTPFPSHLAPFFQNDSSR